MARLLLGLREVEGWAANAASGRLKRREAVLDEGGCSALARCEAVAGEGGCSGLEWRGASGSS